MLTTVRLGRQIARALGAAHKAGIIHRDLKPANIMVTPKNQVKILDFGLARATERGAGAMPTLPDVTTSGMVLGTAAYLSPEQVKGEHADIRSDIWALGCVLYQMLAGRRPFPGDTIPEILAAVLRDEPASIVDVNAGVPASLAALVDKCLSKEPNMRPQSAFEISSGLKDIFHQIRPGSAAPALVSSDSLESGAVHVNLRNVDTVNRYLKVVNPAFPQFSMKDAGPSAVEVEHRGAKVGILFCTKQRDGADVLAFVSELFPMPSANREAFFKRLLSLSNGHTDVAQFSIDREAGMVHLTCVRACDSLDPVQFQHTLDAMSDAVINLARPLRKEFGVEPNERPARARS